MAGAPAATWWRVWPWTIGVFVLGALARLQLIGLTAGKDFVGWERVIQVARDGGNIYRAFPSGGVSPFAYPPLYVFIEAPLQWLSEATSWSFTVVGKLPTMAADVLAAVVLLAALRRRGHGDGLVALGVALWWLNPLVLYNGAFYGRFDSIAVALFALAWYWREVDADRDGAVRWRFPLAYGTAIAMKLFPAVSLPWLLVRDRGRWRVLGAAIAVPLVVTLPYLLDGPGEVWEDIVRYDAERAPSDLSWQTVLRGRWDPQDIKHLGFGLLVLTGVVLIALAVASWVDFLRYSVIGLLVFFALSKLVIEQYYLWPLPFLIVLAVDERDWPARVMVVLLSFAGTAWNAHTQLFGWKAIDETELRNVMLSLVCLGGAIALTITAWRRGRQPSASSPPSSASRRASTSVSSPPISQTAAPPSSSPSASVSLHGNTPSTL